MLVIGTRTIGSNAVMKTQVKISLTILGTIFSLLSSTAYAGQATIPNTFVSGTAAKASEVNGNFNSLKTAVDDNDARISANASGISKNAADIANIPVQKQVVAIDANGNELGLVFGGNNQVISILTPEGYAAEVFARSAFISAGDSLGSSRIAFTDADCGASGGQRYVGFDGNSPSPQSGQPYFPGTVIAASNDVTQPQPLFYVPKPATFVGNITVQSVYEGPQNGCQSVATVLQDAVEVFPNDPAITGFPNNSIPAPITIDYR